MANQLDSIFSYNDKYVEVANSRQRLNPQTCADIKSAEVVMGRYSKEVCFTMINGVEKNVTLGRDFQDVEVGTLVEPSKCELYKLQRAGCKTIDRVDIAND